MTTRFALAMTLALLLCAGRSQAAIEYTFTGTLPTGSTMHTQVSDGETWTATFLIDETTAAGAPDFANAASYLDAVISGSLSFSGGYVSPFNFSSGYDVVVFNEATAGVDALFIRETAVNAGIRFQAVTSDEAFTSTALPLPGASISPNPATFTQGFVQLQGYSDTFGTIDYTTSTANNVSFVAAAVPTSAVPEPVTFVMWGGLAMCSGLVSRRSRQS